MTPWLVIGVRVLVGVQLVALAPPQRKRRPRMIPTDDKQLLATRTASCKEVRAMNYTTATSNPFRINAGLLVSLCFSSRLIIMRLGI